MDVFVNGSLRSWRSSSVWAPYWILAEESAPLPLPVVVTLGEDCQLRRLCKRRFNVLPEISLFKHGLGY